jgi:uncharacterized protein
MSAVDNQKMMERIFAELAQGTSRSFVESLAPNVRFRTPGTGAFAGTYEGKEAVLEQLLRPVMALMTQPYRVLPERILASGDEFVVVEMRGDGNRTKSGVAYDNAYCWVCRVVGGKLEEIREYADTELFSRVVRAELPAQQSASSQAR